MQVRGSRIDIGVAAKLIAVCERSGANGLVHIGPFTGKPMFSTKAFGVGALLQIIEVPHETFEQHLRGHREALPPDALHL